MNRHCFTLLLCALAASATNLSAQTPPLTPDIPPKFVKPTAGYDYDKREVMIPMRDGVKLYTVIVDSKWCEERADFADADAVRRVKSCDALRFVLDAEELPQGDEVFVKDGYIRVFQDIRGKYGSEGDYVMTRPLRGPLNSSEVDHSTDAYDTIDWLVKNVPESNGKVGMLGVRTKDSRW